MTLFIETRSRRPSWSRYQVVRRSDGVVLGYCTDMEAAQRLQSCIGIETCTIEQHGGSSLES